MAPTPRPTIAALTDENEQLRAQLEQERRDRDADSERIRSELEDVRAALAAGVGTTTAPQPADDATAAAPAVTLETVDERPDDPREAGLVDFDVLDRVTQERLRGFGLVVGYDADTEELLVTPLTDVVRVPVTDAKAR